MRKVEKIYCSKGRHPNWRPWRAKYDMSDIEWPWLGEFCIYCGCRVSDSAVSEYLGSDGFIIGGFSRYLVSEREVLSGANRH